MINSLVIRNGRSPLPLLACTLVGAQCQTVCAQSNATVTQFKAGPHVGRTENALVAIEVRTSASDGAVERLRRGCGFVIRCDGLVLVPTKLLGGSVEVAGRTEDASDRITVVIRPGQSGELRLSAAPVRKAKMSEPFVVLRIDELHTTSARTLLPMVLTAATPLSVLWRSWDPSLKGYGTLRQESVVISPPDEGNETAAGWIPFAEPLVGAPSGSVVMGPDGMIVGLTGSPSPDGRTLGFTSFASLGKATNCVTPASLPDSTPSRAAQVEGDGSLMIDVPGGPIWMPPAVMTEQPDMQGRRIACVGPYKIDRFEVTNDEYLEYWKTTSPSDRKKFGFRSSHYPSTWAQGESPFPAEMAKLPVLGVSPRGAADYAAWRGKRLLTPYEWCLAALGPAGPTDPPQWVGTYIGQRNAAWKKITQMHSDRMFRNPGLQQQNVFVPNALRLPWIAKTPLFDEAAVWSKRIIQENLDGIWTLFQSPDYVLAVGARTFDTSPHGASDMLLNAYEIVAPPPSIRPTNPSYYLRSLFAPGRQGRDDPWWPRTIDITTNGAPLQPLQRLRRRTLMSPSPEEILTWHNINEVVLMLAPIGDWQIVPADTTEVSATTWAAGRFPANIIDLAQSLAPWKQPPAHFTREMGMEVPLTTTDRQFAPGASLFYTVPVGFRCAR